MAGFSNERPRASHCIYVQAGNPASLSVPVHGNKDLKKGLQIDLMKEAGLTENDL